MRIKQEVKVVGVNDGRVSVAVGNQTLTFGWRNSRAGTAVIKISERQNSQIFDSGLAVTVALFVEARRLAAGVLWRQRRKVLVDCRQSKFPFAK